MNIKKIISDKYVTSILLVAAGLFLGWLIFRPAKIDEHNALHNSESSEKTSVWTCSMHPQIRSDKPGKCPLCGMDLIPVSTESGASDPDALEMTEEAMRLADVQTVKVSAQNPTKTLHLYGQVQSDERSETVLAAPIPGRIERLSVNSVGETMQKGQRYAVIWSPELITVQNDLLQAVRMGKQGKSLAEAARNKLKYWKLTDEQIATTEQSGNVQAKFDLYSDLSGIVISKRVNEGDYVTSGTVLYDISDLNNIWIIFDAYESDLPWLKKGDKITFSTKSIPGKEYEGRITFIDPVVDPQTRTVKIRAEYDNRTEIFKPGMFVTGRTESRIIDKRKLPSVPNSAILWTGNRSIVYVKDPDAEKPTFKMREVMLGVSLGDARLIEKGLKEGEEVVINGAFEIDAAAQLAGKPGMMNPPDETVDHKTSVKEANIHMIDIGVRGLCGMCKKNIETAAKSVDGVKSAEWSAEKQSVRLMFDEGKTNRLAIEKAIAAVGYDTENVKAPDEVYNQLPGCCRYRK